MKTSIKVIFLSLLVAGVYALPDTIDVNIKDTFYVIDKFTVLLSIVIVFLLIDVLVSLFKRSR